MSDKLWKIFTNVIWMLFDKILILVLNLVVTVKVANYYGTLGYGTYQYAVSVVAIFEILVTVVDSRVVKKSYADNNSCDVVWTATIARIVLSGISLFVGLIYIIFNNEGNEYNSIFVILLINAIVINLKFGMQNRYEYLLNSRKVIIASNIGLIIGGIFQLIAVYFKLALVYVALITVMTSFVSLVVVYLQYIKDYGRVRQKKYRKDLVVSYIKESLPLAIAASCAIVYSKCDSIMIGNMLSKEEVGIYSISIKLVTIVQIALAPIRESVYPGLIELYATDKEKYAKRYVQISALLTWIYIVGTLFSFIVLPSVFHFLNREYRDAFPIYKIYVLGTFFMYNAGLRAGHYTLIYKGTILMYSQIISVLLNICLNYFLIQCIGGYGAAVATVITQCISLSVLNLFFGEEGRKVFIWQVRALNPMNIFIEKSI